MSVGSLEEIIDDNHAIVSTSVGSEHYVSILSFVDKDQLEPGCSVLLNHKVHAVVGVLSDDTDPMVTVMKLEKAPQETYADIGGLDQQIQVSLLLKIEKPEERGGNFDGVKKGHVCKSCIILGNQRVGRTTFNTS